MAVDAFAEGTDCGQIGERTPLERVAQSNGIAGVAVYLSSDATLCTTGETLKIDGGCGESSL